MLIAQKVTIGDLMDMYHNRNRIMMQFHITGKCNLRCKHCYRVEGDVEPLSYKDIINVFNQFFDLRTVYNEKNKIKKRGHINITGGEPFIRKDIYDILQFLGESNDRVTYGVLSNGTPIDDTMIKILKETKASFVQLSIDGDKSTHDYLRAPGDYDRTFKTAAALEKAGIKTFISFTANASNYKHIPSVAHKCRQAKITKLWSDRLVPIGNGSELSDLEITKDLMPEYVKYLKKAQGNFIEKAFNKKTQISSERALQFIDNKNSSIYSCSAGISFLTVDEFGQIMPCRRMPIICGNIFDNTLKDIFYNNDIFKKLRNPVLPKECTGCVYNIFCKGGAKCQSYAKYKDFNRADPGCFLI